MIYKIYSLSDPRDNRIRYIGLTKQTLQQRLTGHLKYAKRNIKTHVCCWIRLLQNNNLTPIINLIEETDDPFREQYYIDKFRSLGFDLTNIAKGGYGGAMPPEIAKATGLKRRGYKLSEEHAEKLKASRRGMKCSEEQKQAISKANKGKIKKGQGRLTHCKKGHEFTPENTIKSGEQQRCKICYKNYQKEWYKKNPDKYEESLKRLSTVKRKEMTPEQKLAYSEKRKQKYKERKLLNA